MRFARRMGSVKRKQDNHSDYGRPEKLFYELDWQSPSALWDEWVDVGEAALCGRCGRLFLISDTEKCPHCGT